jgi:GTP-binding protein LepA
MKLEIITPKKYLGQVMKLAKERKAIYRDMRYLDAGEESRVVLHYEIPLASLIVDFYDKLKSVSQGYASLNYEFLEYRPCQIVKLDILVAGEKVEALSSIVYKDEAYQKARKIVDSLKDVLPRQLFEVKIQAAIGGKIIASARLPAMRKDVTAKLYGGDVTRKKKLLEKQKKGKRRMKAMGKVDIPTEVYRAVLK